MIKGVFVIDSPEERKINKALKLKINSLFLNHKHLKRGLIGRLKRKRIKFYVEIGIFVGQEFWQKYPQSRPIGREGNPIDKIGWYFGVCPNHPDVRREKRLEIEELISSFPIDGIWLDFIRYPCHWKVPQPELTEYCFCQNCLEKFGKVVKRSRRGVNGFPRGGKKMDSLWFQWKCAQITSFVAQVRRLIDQTKKNIQLGIFTVPWREDEFDGAIKKIIGQNFESLAKFVDVFSPMVYHKMCGRTTRWIHEIVGYTKQITGKKVLPIIQTEDKPARISPREFENELKQAAQKPSEGVIVFFLEDLLKDKEKVKKYQHL